MSTPRVLLGKSLTCPSEASTEKPFPRYFWMVFALAGDSTMTKPFDNGSSYFLEYGFEASTNGRKATSYWAKAIGSWLLAFGSQPLCRGGTSDFERERGQHSHDPFKILV